LKSKTEKEKPELQRKPIHGKFYRDLERPNVEKENSLAWVCSSCLKEESESLIIAAKGQTLSMRYCRKNIMTQLIVK
jgi:hypothetical protein